MEPPPQTVRSSAIQTTLRIWRGIPSPSLFPERPEMGARPSRSDRFDFVPADVLADFAAKHDIKMRGHTLVWHEQIGHWFASTVTKENARSYLENHVREVMGHYRGRMHSWDVVNEAIHRPDGRPDGLRKTPWLELLGPEYLEIAYTVAAETDPRALLVYNDFGLDYDTPAQQAKRDAVLGLLRSLRKRKIPVQAFGMQAHLSAAEQPQFKRTPCGDSSGRSRRWG